MPGGPTAIIAAHLAELQKQQAQKRAVAERHQTSFNAPAAPSAAEKRAVAQRHQTTTKQSSGILSSQSSYTSPSNASVILANRIAQRKAAEQRQQGRYAYTHNKTNIKTNDNALKTSPNNGIMQRHNQAQVENSGTLNDAYNTVKNTAKNAVNDAGIIGENILQGKTVAKQHPSTQKTATNNLSSGILGASQGNEAATIKNNTTGRTFVNPQGKTVAIKSPNSAGFVANKALHGVEGIGVNLLDSLTMNISKTIANRKDASDLTVQNPLNGVNKKNSILENYITTASNVWENAKKTNPNLLPFTLAQKVLANFGVNSVTAASLGYKNEDDMAMSVAEKMLSATNGYYKRGDELQQEAQNYSSTVQTAGDVAESIGNMAGIVGAGAITRNPDVALSLYYQQAKGSYAQNIYNQLIQTANQNGGEVSSEQLKDILNKSNQAGQFDAAVDTLTEGISGGIFGLGKGAAGYVAGKLGRSLLSEETTAAINKFTESTSGRIAKYAINAGGEGLEEVIMTLAQPFIERALANNAADNATFKQTVDSFKIGGLVSLLLGIPYIGTSKTSTDNTNTDNTTKGVRGAAADGILGDGATSVNNGMSAAIGNNRSNGIEQSNKNDYNNIIESNGEANQSERTDTGKLGTVDNGTENSLDRETSGRLLQRSVVPETNQSIESAGTERQGNSGRLSGLLSASTREKMNGAVAEKTTQSANELESQWNDLKDQYGTWKNEQAPQQINDKQVVSKFVDNFLANVENPEIQQEIKQRVLNGDLTHERYTDQQAQADIAAQKTTFGEDAVLAKMQEDLKGINKIKIKQAVTGQIESLVDATNKGDGAAALDLARLLSQTGTNLGQGIQAYSQLKKLTPAGRIMYAQQQINADYAKKFGYAPEAIKADIDQNVKDQLPNIVNDGIDKLGMSDTDLNKQAAEIIKAGIQNGDLDISGEIEKGNVQEIAQKLTDYALNNSDIDVDATNTVDLFNSIVDDIQPYVKEYRGSVIQDMAKGGGKNKKNTFLKMLLEYNNEDAFDDPQKAAAISDKYNLPILTKEDANKIISAAESAKQYPEGSREQLKEYGKINDLISSKQKVTVPQKISTVQTTSMLGNMRTMLRNIVPNVVMTVPNNSGDILSTVLDKQIAKKTGQRTTGLPANPINAVKDVGGGVMNAVNDVRDNIDTSLAGNRDYIPFGDAFSNKNPVGWTINKAAKGVKAGLQIGDRPFEDAYYNNSLRRQMQLNHVSEPTELMKDIARYVAIQRTWKDENVITKGFLNARKLLNGGKEFGLGNIIIPFAKTPANLLKAIYDYSPASVATILRDVKKFREADAGDEKIWAQFNLVNDTSKAIGGTIISAIIYAAAKAGIIGLTGAGNDNSDREKYNEQVLGWQPYSVKIGDKYYSYAWVQPFGTQIGTAVNVLQNMQNIDQMQSDKASTGFADATLGALASAGKMIYDQTVLQGVSTLFSGDNVLDNILSVVANAPQQFIPTLVGQLAAAIDPYKRQTYMSVGNDNMISGTIGNMVRGVENKIPFLSETLSPKYNSLGEPMERFSGGKATDVLNSFLNPAQVSQITNTDVTSEITRLENSKNEKLYPSLQSYTLDAGDKTIRLTSDEMNDWNKTVGSEFNDSVEKLINSDAYKNMSDTEKASAISKIHEDLNSLYKYDFLKGKNITTDLASQYKKVQGALNEGIPLSDYVTISVALNSINDDGKGNASARKRDFIFNYGLSDKQTVYVLENKVFTTSDSLKNQATNLLSEAGIPLIDTYKAYSEYEKISSTVNTKAANYDLPLYIQLNLSGLSSEQSNILSKTIVNTIDPYGYFTPVHVDYSGDADTAKMSAMSKTMKKYLSDAHATGMTDDEFMYAYSFFSNVKVDAPGSSYAAAIDKLDLTAQQKQIMLDARYIHGKFNLHDGGTVKVKGHTFGTDSNLSASTKSSAEEKSLGLMDNYVPPSSRDNSTPSVIISGDNHGKSMTVVAGDYNVSLNKITSSKGAYNAKFTTKTGSAAISPKEGIVKSVKKNVDMGYITITIKYNDGTTGTYIGISDTNIKAKDKVTEGQRIGSTDSSMTFIYRDKDGNIVNPDDTFNIKGGSGTIKSTTDYYPTQTVKSYDNTGYRGYSGWKNWGHGYYHYYHHGYGGGNHSAILASLIGRKSKYSRFSYGGWPTFTYTGNENKKSS